MLRPTKFVRKYITGFGEEDPIYEIFLEDEDPEAAGVWEPIKVEWRAEVEPKKINPTKSKVPREPRIASKLAPLYGNFNDPPQTIQEVLQLGPHFILAEQNATDPGPIPLGGTMHVGTHGNVYIQTDGVDLPAGTIFTWDHTNWEHQGGGIWTIHH